MYVQNFRYDPNIEKVSVYGLFLVLFFPIKSAHYKKKIAALCILINICM